MTTKKERRELIRENEGKYHLYDSTIDRHIKKGRRTDSELGKIKENGLDPFVEYSEFYMEHYGNIFNTPLFTKVFALENDLYENDSPSIFPQSKTLIEALHDSKFTTQNAIMELPFKTFTISMPKGIKVDRYDLPGVAVAFGNSYEVSSKLDDQLYKKFRSDFEMQIPSKEVQKELERYMEIVFLSPVTNTVICKNIREDVLDILLSAKDFKGYEATCKKKELELNRINTNLKSTTKSQDKINDEISYVLFKTIATIAVYLSANNERFKEGLPGRFQDYMNLNREHLSPKRSFYLESSPSIESFKDRNSDGEVKAHYRRMHFRNLKNAKYYQGEHKDKEIGSRWVEVSDTLVNRKIRAYSVTDELSL